MLINNNMFLYLFLTCHDTHKRTVHILFLMLGGGLRSVWHRINQPAVPISTLSFLFLFLLFFFSLEKFVVILIHGILFLLSRLTFNFLSREEKDRGSILSSGVSKILNVGVQIIFTKII